MRRTIMVAGVVAALCWQVPTSWAQELPPTGSDVDITVDGGGALAALDEVSPGETRSGGITVTNGGTAPVVLQVRAVDIVEWEDGCGTDEAVVDTSCIAGNGAGELGSGAVFSIWRTPVATAMPLYEGSIYELDAVRLGVDPLAAGETLTFRFDYGLPSRVGNDTQGDQLAFDLEVVAQQSAEVGGVVVERLPGARLAVTGRDTGRLVIFASVALLSGVGLVLLVRSQHRRSRVAGGHLAC
jgi:hypothetical protein